MRLQSAIFDMDGTLLDSMAAWDIAPVEFLRAHGKEPDPDFREITKVMTVQDCARYCRDTYDLPMTVEEVMHGMNAMMEDFYTTRVQLKPGVKNFLSLLKMEGVWMYVATNTDRHLVQDALKHTGIDSYFRGILTCSEVGAGKQESPEIYERALRRLRSTKKDTVVFEDAVHAIRTAKAAGFRVAAVYDASEEANQEEIRRISDYYIRSFEEMFETESLI